MGSLWGHFGDGWAPPPSWKGASIWDPFLVTFRVPFGTPWETLGDPKGSKRGQRLSEDGFGEGPREGPPNGPFFTSPGLGSGELSPRREHSFHYFRRVTFGSDFAPFWDPFWTQEGRYARPGGSRDAPGGSKRGTQKGSFSNTRWRCLQELRESRSGRLNGGSRPHPDTRTDGRYEYMNI